MKKFLAVLLAFLMIAVMTSCSKNSGNDDDTTAAEDDNTAYYSSDAALESEHFKITMGELSYVFYENYRDFVMNNYDNLNVYGLDTTSSIKTQTYYGTTTWFKYFADASTGYAQDILLLCESAYDAGIELDDEDNAGIDDTIKSIINYANDNGYQTDEYLRLAYSSNVTLDVVRSFLEKETLGLKYYYELVGQYRFSDDELNQYVADNADKFSCISYMSYTFDEDKDNNAEAAAEELSQITDKDTFAEYVFSYLSDSLGLSEEEKGSVDIYTYYASKNSESAFSEWAFGENSSVNQTYTDINDVDGEYTVYLLTMKPSLQDYVARNIRYIFTSLETYNTYTAALEKANELLNQWKEGEATDHSFGEMAYNYSDDRETSNIGGVVYNVSRQNGTAAFPDKLLSWLYSDSTAVGDTAIIRGDNGYYIVYYSSDGEIEWKYEAEGGLAAARYESDHAAMSEKYAVTTNDAVVSAIDA